MCAEDLLWESAGSCGGIADGRLRRQSKRVWAVMFGGGSDAAMLMSAAFLMDARTHCGNADECGCWR